MSHHRELVTAPGAPAAVGPYSHAVDRRRPALLLRPDAARPRDEQLVEGTVGRPQRAAAWTTSRRCARPPAPRSPTPCAAGSTSPTCRRFAEVNAAYAEYFPGEPPARTTIGVAALPLGADVEIDAIVALPG